MPYSLFIIIEDQMMKVAYSIEDVLSILEEIILQGRKTENKITLFAAVFQQVGLRVSQDIDQGNFQDAARMEELIVRLANRYFEALSQRENKLRITRSWELVLTSSQRTDLLLLQHLLLAGNAHINLDLAVATSQISPGNQLEDFKDDFEKINDILAEVFDLVQEAINQSMPLMNLIDNIGGNYDEILLNFTLKEARQIAWNNAKTLACETPEKQVITLDKIDRRTSALSRLIIAPNRWLGNHLQLLKLERESRIDIIEQLKKSGT